MQDPSVVQDFQDWAPFLIVIIELSDPSSQITQLAQSTVWVLKLLWVH